MSAFRALYIAERSRKKESPRITSTFQRKFWSRSKSSKDGSLEKNNLPSIPDPVLTGVRTYIERAPFDGENSMRSQENIFPPNNQSILVTKQFSSGKVASRHSVCESFIIDYNRYHMTDLRLRLTKLYELQGLRVILVLGGLVYFEAPWNTNWQLRCESRVLIMAFILWLEFAIHAKHSRWKRSEIDRHRSFKQIIVSCPMMMIPGTQNSFSRSLLR